MTNDVLLSICIPTYNRAKYLSRALKSIFDNMDSFSSLIEVIVSDNCSQDDTTLVCDEYSGYASFKYFRNEENKGPDYNISKCYHLAKGKYVWILGDDDYIRQGGIKSVLELLKLTSYPDIISLGADFNTSSKLNGINSICNYTSFESPRLYAAAVGIMLTFISGTVIKKDSRFNWDECLNSFGSTSLIQLSWILKQLSDQGHFIKVDDILVIAEPDNTGGYRLFEVFSANLKYICDSIFGSKSPITHSLLRASSKFLLNFAYDERKSNFTGCMNFSMLDAAFGSVIEYKLCYRFLYRHYSIWRLAKFFKKLIRELYS